VVKALHAKGHSLRAMVRNVAPEWMNKLSGLEVMEGDVEIQETLTNLMEDVELVVHCAAVVSLNNRDQALVNRVNVEGTRNVVNACLQGNVPALLHMSSVAAIGHGDSSGIFNEDTPWTEATGFYAQSKYDAELEVHRGIAEGLRAVIVNPSVVLAPDDHGKSSGRLVRYAKSGTWFHTDGKVNLVDVRDVAEAVVHLTAQNRWVNGERFILSAGSLSWKNFLGGMAERCGRRRPFFSLAKPLVRLAMKIAGLPSSQADSAFSQHSYNASKIRSSTGLSFRSLEETLDWASGNHPE